MIAGFGFRGAAQIASLQDALARAAEGRDVTAIATLADKAETPVFRAFAQTLAVPVHAVTTEAATAMDTATHSPAARVARGTGSVAEATALAAAGPGAALIAPRCVSQDRLATCALAAPSQPGDMA